MPNFTKILGVPGAGKTTCLINELEKLINEGKGDMESMCFVTFSKSTGREIKARIAEKYGVKPKELPYYGTIHSVCNRLLGWITRDPGGIQIASNEDKDDYLSQYGLTYPVVNNSSNELPETAILNEDFIETTDEEKIFSVINWCNNRLVPVENWKDIGVIFDYIEPSMISEICKGWSEYKHEKSVIDFDDMLLEVIKEDLSPYTKNLFVDEFQDMTPLLHRVISSWSKDKENVFVAGDPNQAIFTWSGASPHFLLDLPADERVLCESYRVPSEILKKAETLISTTRENIYPYFHSVKHGGHFIHLHNPFLSDILEYLPNDPRKNVFFLFRTNYLANNFCTTHLIPSGIPYAPVKPTRRIHDVWRCYRKGGQKLLEIRNAMSKMQRNDMLKRSEALRLLLMLPSCSKKRLNGYVRYGKKTFFKKSSRTEWTVKELLDELLVKLPDWNDHWILSNLNYLEKEAYVANMQSNYCSLSPRQIKVGTLHSSKGLEADTVFVFNTHTKRVDDHLLEEGHAASDDETRLYYVGITRARETCVLVDDFAEFENKYTFDLEVE